MGDAKRKTELFSPFVRRVWQTIRERQLFSKGERVLVAVSGGADSMVLLETLTELRRALKLDLVAAYVDHGLRRGTKRDSALVEKFAQSRGIPFERLIVKVEPRASLEEAAREARLEALSKRASRLGCTRIALGHTATDQAETVLLWLLRGTGIRGLAGMRPVRAQFVRPLIDLTREEIRKHAARAKIPYRDDPMNADPRFTRNRIRKELLPALARTYNPQIARRLAALADDFAALNDWLDAAAKCEISVRALRALPHVLRDRAIDLKLKDVSPKIRLARTHRDAINSVVMGAKGRSRLVLPSMIVLRTGDRLEFVKTSSDQQLRNLRAAVVS